MTKKKQRESYMRRAWENMRDNQWFVPGARSQDEVKTLVHAWVDMHMKAKDEGASVCERWNNFVAFCSDMGDSMPREKLSESP